MASNPLFHLEHVEFNLSPCPNDIFMISGWDLGLSDHDIKCKPVIFGVQSLNELALKSQPKVSKISATTYLKISHLYDLLPVGATFSHKTGPLLVQKKYNNFSASSSGFKVAVGGKNTTASALLKMYYPNLQQVYCDFSKVFSLLEEGKVEFAVVIHESRLLLNTYDCKECEDLGALWVKDTSLPIILGVLVVRKDVCESVRSKISSSIRKSIKWGLQNKTIVSKNIVKYSQENDLGKIWNHIDNFTPSYCNDDIILKSLSLFNSRVNRL